MKDLMMLVVEVLLVVVVMIMVERIDGRVGKRAQSA